MGTSLEDEAAAIMAEIAPLEQVAAPTANATRHGMSSEDENLRSLFCSQTAAKNSGPNRCAD